MTKDKGFKQLDKKGQNILWLQGSSLDLQAQELKERLDLNWSFQPLTRCIICNQQVVSAPTTKITLLPERIQKGQKGFTFCPQCQRVYWEGSHAERMRERLHRWNQ